MLEDVHELVLCFDLRMAAATISLLKAAENVILKKVTVNPV